MQFIFLNDRCMSDTETGNLRLYQIVLIFVVFCLQIVSQKISGLSGALLGTTLGTNYQITIMIM